MLDRGNTEGPAANTFRYDKVVAHGVRLNNRSSLQLLKGSTLRIQKARAHTQLAPIPYHLKWRGKDLCSDANHTTIANIKKPIPD